MSTVHDFESEYYTYSDEINNRRCDYQATWALTPAPAPVRPCGNPLCTTELTDADIDTLLALFRTLDPAWREYLALSLTGPEYYCVAQEPCSVAQKATAPDPRPAWQIVADPRTYEGTYGRELIRGR